MTGSWFAIGFEPIRKALRNEIGYNSIAAATAKLSELIWAFEILK